MGVVQNIMGIVRDVQDRRENARIEDIMRNNLNDPMAMLEGVAQIDPFKGRALADQETQRRAAAAAAEQASIDANSKRLGMAMTYLRGVPQEQLGEAFTRYAPLFAELGVNPASMAAIRDQALASPDYLPSLDEESYRAMMKDNYTTTVMTPGSHALRGGEQVHSVPFAQRPVTVGSAQTGYTASNFDPNTGEFGPPEVQNDQGFVPGVEGPPVDAAASPFELSVDALRPHFIAQESGGDYTAVNSETGALGAYQVMPDTGRALAQRLGLAWRPDMMRKDDPTSRRYQDAIGGAAIQEAVENSNGDPATAFGYYYGGPDRNKWGPRTARYQQEMLGRVGGAVPASGAAQQARVTRDGITVAAAPPKPVKQTRVMTPQEVAAAGLRPGTAAEVDDTGNITVLQNPPAASLTARQRENASQKLTLLRQMEGQLARVEEAMENIDEKGWTGFVGGMVPGGLDPESNRFDKAVAGLTALVRNLTRTPGEGSMSDYESKLASAIPPSRRDTPEGREEAMGTLRDLITSTRAGYEEMMQAAQGGQPSQASGSVAVGAIARDAQGNRRRFRGGDSSVLDNWEIIQ